MFKINNKTKTLYVNENAPFQKVLNELHYSYVLQGVNNLTLDCAIDDKFLISLIKGLEYFPQMGRLQVNDSSQLCYDWCQTMLDNTTIKSSNLWEKVSGTTKIAFREVQDSAVLHGDLVDSKSKLLSLKQQQKQKENIEKIIAVKSDISLLQTKLKRVASVIKNQSTGDDSTKIALRTSYNVLNSKQTNSDHFRAICAFMQLKQANKTDSLPLELQLNIFSFMCGGVSKPDQIFKRACAIQNPKINLDYVGKFTFMSNNKSLQGVRKCISTDLKQKANKSFGEGWFSVFYSYVSPVLKKADGIYNSIVASH